MIETNKYPLDFEAIEKGDVIDTDLLEKITATKRGTKEFQLKILSLRQMIMDKTDFTVKTTNETLIVLKDEQSSEYNDKEFYKGIRKTRQAHKRMMNVDTRLLNPTAREMHERKMMIQTRYVSAIKQTKKFEVKTDNQKALTE